MDRSPLQTPLEELQRLPVAGELPAPHLATLAGLGRVEDLAAGTVLQHEGQRADRLHLLLTGRVALYLGQVGAEEQMLGTVSRGEFVGWTALVPGVAERAGARALKPCRTIAFEAGPLRDRCQQDPSFGYALMQVALAAALGQMSDCHTQLADLYGPSGR